MSNHDGSRLTVDASVPHPAGAPVLVGRDADARRVRSVVDGLPRRGASLLVRGEAGIGKTSLIDVALHEAGRRGIPVMAASSVEAEAQFAFAGLHLLLRPLLGELRRLPVGQRRALLAAFGMVDGSPPDPFLLALGTLELLASVAREHGLVIALADAQWLDAPSAGVVAFVARRCADARIAMLIEVRDGRATPFTELGLPELVVEPLPPEAALALLDATSPGLAAGTRDRVLALAQGNPLALVEIPRAVSGPDPRVVEGGEELALTSRLERAFGSRLAELPEHTRTLVVIAAEDDDQPRVDEILQAAVRINPDVGPEAFGPAVDAGLVTIQHAAVRFRHPLVRSAVRSAATATERRRANEALAAVLPHDADRQAWHRAAATIGHDESVAAALEGVAGRAGSRGGATAAIATLERAALLTPQPASRARRLLRAAELAIEAGDPARAAHLAREAEASGVERADVGRLRLVREMLSPTPSDEPRATVRLTSLAEELLVEGQPDLAVQALLVAGARAWATDTGQAARDAIVRAAESIPAAGSDPRIISVLAFADPERHGSAIVARSLQLVPEDLDPVLADLVGVALNLTGSFDLSDAFLAAAVTGLRRDGRLGLLPAVFAHRAWTAVNVVDWRTAITAAEEGIQMSRLTEQPLWEAASLTAMAMVAGLRGDAERQTALTDEAERLALPLSAGAVLAGVQLTRGVAALADGQHEVAYEHLRRGFDPGDPSYHHFQRTWTIGDFVEAAVRSGHAEQARSRVEELEPLAASSRSSWLAAGLTYARPLIADDGTADLAFRSALDADLSGWPLYRGRLLFQYGSWLRRQRRVVESRQPLSDARDWFDRYGIKAWGDRARHELRASGVGSPRASREAWTALSPQELQIAMMAAEGLTNQEIGGRLFLSRRTVGSHLYRVFPKLGVTSRSQLRTALEARHFDVESLDEAASEARA